MTERERISLKAQAFFEDLWRRGDPWELKSSEFERDKYARQLALLRDRRYARALEIGCGNGCFTRLLLGIADHTLALDISPTAIAQARQATDGVDEAVEFRVANIMDYDPNADGPWDAVVMSETICYLGWLYPLFDVAWLASQLFGATRAGGRLLMANTCGGVEDHLLHPWIIRTYRDLFVNVGYRLETEEIFHGTKNGAQIEVLISLLAKLR
ncbi:MAG TPA: class I SAM-dependent methyltransferase [Candidatus Eisenbacteria bacterium]|nr:class I SAM-dependent methyltransferase [Candidatus Eisenbacteria bacterium]